VRSRLVIFGTVGVLLAGGGSTAIYLLTRPPADEGGATDPAAAVADGRCMKVTAKDVRVFTDASGDQIWTRWTKETRFWAQPGAGTDTRQRTVLRNGSQGWVTSDARYVAPASDCR
jgi:hypothetical protein